LAGIITLLIILILSFLVTRVATIMLIHTGLSKHTAKFQARSAFTGVGFTTTESEKVVNNPVRRRILLTLMLLGNAGIITGISSLIIGFTGIEGTTDAWLMIAVLILGLILLWTIANSRIIEGWLSNIISRLLKKYTKLDITDYASLLHLSKDYRITEIGIEEGHWLCEKKIKDTRLRDEGLIILAINRKDGTFLGAPQADSIIKTFDTLLLYGRAPALIELEKRHAGFRGNVQHRKLVREQKKVAEKEGKQEETTTNDE